jgi:hypothetical protein
MDAELMRKKAVAGVNSGAALRRSGMFATLLSDRRNACWTGPIQPAVFAQPARSESAIKSRVIGTASRLVDSSN